MRVSGSLNNFKLSQKYFLILIVLIGAFLRLVDLGAVPRGLYFDEVLYGLDSYSILKTGRDLYSHLLPLTFQSSGYYPPLYTYILVPFLAVLGLSSWSVRLPAALAGAGGVLAIYFLAKIIVGKKKSPVPLIASFLLAFSPWHIHLSRVAFLAGFGIIFMILAVYLLLRFPDKKFSLATSALIMAISTQIHYGYKLISPLLFVLLVILMWKKMKMDSKKIMLVIAIWFAAILLNGLAYKYYNAGFRVNELSGKSAIRITKAYLNSFSFDFLFAHGDNYPLENPWQKRGQMQLILLPFLIIGIARLGKIASPTRMILLAWLLLTPIPSAIAGLGAHAIRNSPILIPLTILAAIGVESIIQKAASSKIVLITIMIASGLFLAETFSYLNYYFFDYPKKFSYLWGEPIRKAIDFGLERQKDYDAIVFTDTYNVTLSYLAFETHFPPKQLQKAILTPITINHLPAKKVRNLYFVATEELSDKVFYKNLPPKTLLIDPILYIKTGPLKQVEEDNRLIFQYLEIN